MKILLVTADPGEISWAAAAGLIDGVLTTPVLLSEVAPAGDSRSLLSEICRATALPVAAGVESVNAADIYRDGRELAKLSDQLTVHVPMMEDALGAMRRLRADGVRVAATLVCHPAQALLAAKAGAAAVSAPLPDLESLGVDAAVVLQEMRAVLDAGAMECDVLAEGAQGAARFAACALAGADAVAVTPDVLRALLLHPLTDRGVDRFLSALSRRPRAQAGE